MEDDDRTVVRSSHSHRPELPHEFPDDDQGGNWLPIGTVLGEFEIRGLVGEGGFGIVYLAHDSSLDRMVAIKEFMPAGMASRTQSMQVTVRSRRHVDTFKLGLRSFVNEARLLARFDSPSLVKVYRFWEANGTAYMVMPFYDGLTLRQALKDRQVVPDERWLRAMIASLLDAMDTIHREQCYHRDIAPDNILILRDGRPMLLDFGAARRVIGDATQSLTVILKPGFAPVEQYAEMAGIRQGSWTDIYALAAVAYFVVSGKAPPPAVARMVSDNMVPAREAGRGRYSDPFLRVLDQALAVLPENRLQTVADLRDALGLQEGVPRTIPGMPSAPAGPAGDAFAERWSTDTPRRTGPRSGIQNTQGREDIAGHSDVRVLEPERKRGKAGLVVAAVAVAAGVTAAAVGYRWWNPATQKGPVVADAAPSEPFVKPAAPGTLPVESPAAPTVPAATEAHVDDKLAAPKAAEPAAPPPVAAAPAVPFPAAPPIAPPPVASVTPSLSPEDELWHTATSKDIPSGYEAYLKRYPRGRYASSANAVLESRQPKPTGKPGISGPAAVPPAQSPVAGPDGTAKPREPNRPAVAQVVPNAEQKPPAPAPEQKVADPGAPPALAPLQPTPVAGAAAAAASGAGSAARPADAGSSPQVAARTPRNEPSSTEGTGKEPARPALPAASSPQTPAGAERTIKAPEFTMTGLFTVEQGTGIASGTGQVVWNNGDRFDGRLVRGVKEGRGRFVWANGQSYDGDWVADTPNGRGVMVFANGNRYDGDVRGGEPNGHGVLQFANGHRYEGDVKAGLPNGTGTIRFKSGDAYTGSWSNGKHHGNGRYTWANGTYWEGEFKDNQKTDNGRTVFNDGRVVTGAIPDRPNQPAVPSADATAVKKLGEAAAN